MKKDKIETSMLLQLGQDRSGFFQEREMGDCNSNRTHGFQGRLTMKKGGMLRVLIVVFLAHSVNSFCAAVTINNVQISPDNPSINDIITIETDGTIPGSGIALDESVFTQDEYALQLDLYYTDTFGPQVPHSWFHDEEIGILPQGSYDLSVQAYWRLTDTVDYFLHDSYSTNFEVVPEPTSVLLLLVGVPVMRRLKM